MPFSSTSLLWLDNLTAIAPGAVDKREKLNQPEALILPRSDASDDWHPATD